VGVSAATGSAREPIGIFVQIFIDHEMIDSYKYEWNANNQSNVTAFITPKNPCAVAWPPRAATRARRRGNAAQVRQIILQAPQVNQVNKEFYLQERIKKNNYERTRAKSKRNYS
jgi:hypothetical protein